MAGANAWRAIEGVMADRRRYVKNTGEEGDWKNKTGDRGGWRRIADEAVKKNCRQHLTPAKGKTRKRERLCGSSIVTMHWQ